MGNEELEHPKPMIEVMANTKEVIEGYAQAHQVSTLEAGLVLMFNEIRCLHWHLDLMMEEKQNQRR